MTFISTCPLGKRYGNYVCPIITVACPNSKENNLIFTFYLFYGQAFLPFYLSESSFDR